MITLKQYYAMKVGDVFELCTLFKGLSLEKVLWQCTEANKDGLIFSLSFFGVWLCDFRMHLNAKQTTVLIKEIKP